MQDLVGVGVADAAEEPWIGERSLDGVILGAKSRSELVARCVEHLEAAALKLGEARRSTEEIERRAALGPGFGQRETAVRELELREIGPHALRLERLPMEAS